MGVIYCEQLLDGRGGSTDDQGNVTLTRSWIVKTDNETDDEVVVSQYINTTVADLYSPHPSYPAAIARTIDIKPRENNRTWTVTRGYSSAPFRLQGSSYPSGTGFPEALSTSSPTQPSSSGNNSQPAPDRTPQIKFSRVENQVAIRKDKDGFPLKNLAGDPFEGITVDKPHLAIDIKYWSLNVTVPHILNVWNKTNSAAWNGFPLRTLLVKDWQVTPKNDLIGIDTTHVPPLPIYGLVSECDVRLEYAPETWLLSLANTGRREKVGGIVKDIVGADGSKVDHPVQLTATGAKWSGTGTPPDPITYPIYVEFAYTGLLI